MASKSVRFCNFSLSHNYERLLYSCNRFTEFRSTYTTIPLKNTKQLKPDLNRAINEALKIVRLPTSHLSLSVLLSDDNSNLGVHLRKLASTDHPLLKIRKIFCPNSNNRDELAEHHFGNKQSNNVVYNGKNFTQTRSLVVLLVSKALGFLNLSAKEAEEVSNLQSKLSEITEIIDTAQLIHKSVVNFPVTSFGDSPLNYGNKIAILCGDYLLATACTALASLKYPKVVKLISQAMSNHVQSEFLCTKDSQDNCLPSTNFSIKDWESKSFLSEGSLLSNSCIGALLMAGHDEDTQEIASELGRTIALAWKTHLELQPFLDGQQNLTEIKFDLTSSPVILFLQNNPQFYDHIKGSDYENFDFKSFYQQVAGSQAITEAIYLNHKYTDSAIQLLNQLKDSEAKSAMQNIILGLKEL